MTNEASNPTPAPGSAGSAAGETLRGMPAAEQLAVEAIARLITDGYSSSVMKLDRPTLNELGRRLVEPGQSVNDAAVQWLEERGHVIPQSNVYRFAQRFREVFKAVWGEWASRLLMAEIARDPDVDLSRMQQLIKHRVTTLVAQEMITAQTPDDLDTSRLSAVLAMVSAADKGQLEREKLLLAQAQAEHRAIKLEAEVEKLTIENDRRRRELERSIEAAKKTVQTTTEAGAKAMNADDVIAILDRVMKGEAA